MSALDRFRISPYTYSGLIGAFLATHAIQDAIPYLCTGIGCKAKITTQLGDHDQAENFTTRMGWAELDERDLISGNLEKLKRGILGQISRMKVGLIPVLVSPVVQTIGLEIEPHIHRLRTETGLPLVYVPNANSSSTLWEGYCAVQKSIAGMIDWKTPARDRTTVNIWGYPFSRYEQDDLANIHELKRLLASIGLRVQSMFFSGGPAQELLQAHRAAYNIVLPHAYLIGEHITELSGRPTIYTDLPLGTTGTGKWLEMIGKRTGSDQARIRAFIAHEERQLRTELSAAQRKNKGRTAGIILELPWVAGLTALLKDMGIRTTEVAFTDPYYHDISLFKKTLKYLNVPSARMKVRPQAGPGTFARMLSGSGPDLIISHSLDMEPSSAVDQISIGFPSYDRHHTDQAWPYLGYAGCRNMLSVCTPKNEHRRAR